MPAAGPSSNRSTGLRASCPQACRLRPRASETAVIGTGTPLMSTGPRVTGQARMDSIEHKFVTMVGLEPHSNARRWPGRLYQRARPPSTASNAKAGFRMAQLSPQVQLRLSWGKCNEDKWCPLNTVDLDSPVLKQSGSSVIWHGGTKPRTVYVGQGKFDDPLRSHQQDARIQAYKAHGLYVTWAPVGSQSGMELRCSSPPT